LLLLGHELAGDKSVEAALAAISCLPLGDKPAGDKPVEAAL
jgi:hypothetical protein